ncbi:MAG: Ig-like domain-containing protein [Acidobacteriia bacterium]|nr:Ig-like domain-containing protein [Terriglobia bacterium]
MRSKLWGCLLSVAVSVLWSGCTAVSLGGSGGPGVHLTGISVTPTSADIPVGASRQFTANGMFSDGGTSNVSAKATWKSSDLAVATVDNVGLVKAVSQGKATISATLDSFSSSGAATVDPAAVVSISVTPLGPGITIGAAQPLAATAIYSDGSTVDVTATASWRSSNGAVASVDNTGSVTGVASGQSAISATFDVVTGATAINVITPPLIVPTLNGDYAFSFTSDNASGPEFFVGSFTADGAGNLSGMEDANLDSGVQQEVPLAGTYFIYPDGRGQITFNQNTIHTLASGITFRFVLTSSGSTGSAIQFDGHGSAAGVFEKQDSSAAVTGNYVFRLNGADSVFNPMGQTGLFTADGAGNITAGIEDQSDNGVVPANPTTLTGGTYVIGTNGRGTLTLTSATGTSNFVFYVVSANKLDLMATDATPVLAGFAEKQANQTFAQSNFLGGFAFLLNRAPAGSRSRFDVIGRVSLDGAGTVAGGVEEEVASSIVQNIVNSGTYDVAGNGRGTVQLTTDNGSRSYIFYAVAPHRLFMLDTFSPFAGTGVVDVQLGTLDNSTLAGAYGMAGASIGQDSTEVSAWFTANGASPTGSIQGIEDLIAQGSPSSVLLTATYVVTANGRTFVTPVPPGNLLGVTDYIFYVVSNTQADMLGMQPALDGSALLQ